MSNKSVDMLVRCSDDLYNIVTAVRYAANGLDSYNNYNRVLAFSDELDRMVDRLRILARMEEMKK